MRYKLWHLMLLVLLIALALKGLDVYTHQTVTVRFSDPNVPPLLPDLPPAIPVDGPAQQAILPSFPKPDLFYLEFQVGEEWQGIGGCVAGKFGPNALLRRDVTPENLASLEGVTVQIRYRHRSLPWLPAQHIQDEIGRHFHELLPPVETDLLPPTAWMAGS